MHFFFYDDSFQKNPTRRDMGPMIATGGIAIPADALMDANEAINNLCKEFGIPENEEFKWSPGRELWMHNSLVGEKRTEFFERILNKIKEYQGSARVIIEDTTCECATDTINHKEDVTRLMLERIDLKLRVISSYGVVIVDRPGGGRKDEDKFLGNCLETLQLGTDYIKPKKIVLNVISCPSKLMRFLQVADVVVSCTTSFVTGDTHNSPKTFKSILPLLDRDEYSGRIGGTGLKIHPDFKYRNLYHWLLDETKFKKYVEEISIPDKTRQYFANDGL